MPTCSDFPYRYFLFQLLCYPDYRQVLINLQGIGGYDVGNAATSSFDEPLHKDEVLAIVKPFLA